MNLPQMQLLDFYPVEARHIRQLEKGSKAYKQAVGALKTKLTPTLMNMLRHGKDEAAKPFRRKWKSGYLLAILLLAALMLLCVWVSRRQDRPDLAFWLFALVFVLGVCLLYYLLTMRTVTAYLCFLLDHYQPRQPDWPEETLSAVTAIALYHCRNPQPFAPGDLCGCIRCRAVFPAEKAVKTPEGDTECPGCGGCTVIGGEAGNPGLNRSAPLVYVTERGNRTLVWENPFSSLVHDRSVAIRMQMHLPLLSRMRRKRYSPSIDSVSSKNADSIFRLVPGQKRFCLLLALRPKVGGRGHPREWVLF